MWLALLLVASTPAPLPKIAVMDVTMRGGVTATVTQVLSDAIVAEVRKRRQRSQVISAEEIRSMLAVVGEKQKLGCHGDKDVACLAEIGGALGAEEMVNGTLGKIGKTYVFSLRVVEVSRAKVLVSASVNLATRNDDDLLSAAKSLVAQIFPDVQLAPTPEPTPVPAAALAPPRAVMVATPPPSHSHLPSILLGVGGLACGGVAIFGLTQVLAFNGEANTVSAGNMPGVPALSYGKVTSDQQSAKLWQPLSIVLAAVGVAAIGTAVIVW